MCLTLLPFLVDDRRLDPLLTQNNGDGCIVYLEETHESYVPSLRVYSGIGVITTPTLSTQASTSISRVPPARMGASKSLFCWTASHPELS